MSRVCAITGKRPKVGGRIIHKGVSKKAGGIGLQLVKNNKRTFRPNLQRVRVKLPSGQVKRSVGVSQSNQGWQNSKA